MAGFIYYFPNSDDSKRPLSSGVIAETIIEKCGLADVFQDGSWPRVDVHSGPDNMKGQIVTIQPANPKGKQADCGYYPDRQEWREVKPEGRPTYWIGWMRGARPGPDDLARPKQLRGWPVTLADKQQWTIPVVHPQSISTLPVGFHPNGDGEVHLQSIGGGVEGAEEFYDQIVSKGTFLLGPAFVFCSRVLALNYRVGLYECSSATLGLITSQELDDVIAEAFGATFINQQNVAQKKSEGTPPATSPTSVGVAG